MSCSKNKIYTNLFEIPHAVGTTLDVLTCSTPVFLWFDNKPKVQYGFYIISYLEFPESSFLF